MNRRNHGGKITLGMLKGKPITTSVPSFAIRFHAGGEEIEELYPSEEEEKSVSEEKSEKCTENIATAEPITKQESSPMRDYLNKFGKRSSSIDAGINDTAVLGQQTATADPWRIFSEFRGKLTKTVEEKLSEIKSKSSDGENSPKHVNKSDKNKINNSKDNSSISDSEEQSFSECSIPKSGGLSSTAEDLEMSSEDDTSLAESDRTPTDSVSTEIKRENEPKAKRGILGSRIKKTKPFVKFSTKDDDVKISALSLKHEKQKETQTTASIEDEVESGVEAYEDFKTTPFTNIEEEFISSECLVMPAPNGFVDLRQNSDTELSVFPFRFRYQIMLILIGPIVAWVILRPLPSFLCGVLIGSILATLIWVAYYYFSVLPKHEISIKKIDKNVENKSTAIILEIPAAKEYQPVTKFEGWINEYPEHYDPSTYHIARTQSVYLKLEGNILRVSHTRTKIPKRAMWNEPERNIVFTHHRIYNLQGSQVTLLPQGLIHKRLWSKKYPICVILNREYMNKDLNLSKKPSDESDTEEKIPSAEKIALSDNDTYVDPTSEDADTISQYSQYSHDDTVRDYIADTNSSMNLLEEEKDENIINEDWDTLALEDSTPETKLYLFGRTCRDKEDWYRRLVTAAREEQEEEKHDQSVQTPEIDTSGMHEMPDSAQASEPVISSIPKENKEPTEADYLRYMARFNQVKRAPDIGMRTTSPSPTNLRHPKFFRRRKGDNTVVVEEQQTENNDTGKMNTILWLNAFIARVLYDVFRHETVISKLQFLIQRKLSTIKLPYFIEAIIMSDLSLGNNSPTIHKVKPPSMNERGLWIDMDLTYDGTVTMVLVTKLNLMKLKQFAGRPDEQPVPSPSYFIDTGRSPIYHSDVEDSAESSDEDTAAWMITSNDSNQDPNKRNVGGQKFLRVVDKIAASKYFQQATEYKYIKRAMEGVSKTELKLTVEVQYVEGTLAVNIAAPPSDRLWLGFRSNPRLTLAAKPMFGDRSLNFTHVTRWIENKLAIEFQKFFVLPNMEDFVIPIMDPKLPM